MHVLRLTLAICTFAGFRQPPSWTSLFSHIIYKTYATFLISSLYIFSISQLMDIVLNVDNSNELVDSLYMMLTVFVAGYKQVCMWINRKNISLMINVLSEKPFEPSESHEVLIRRKFEKMIQANTLRYFTLVLAAIVAVFLSSIFMDYMNGNLTYRAWMPFDYSTPRAFTLMFAHQIMATSTSGIVNVACDSLVCGFLLHMCCQLEILEYRLTKVTQDQDALRDCIRHHNHLFEYAQAVNSTFAKVIGMQFAVSMLAVCTNLYQIAMAKNYTEFVPLMLYTGCMLTQILMYCWFGNEVKLKSIHLADSVYNIKWPELSNNSKKALLIIMKRTLIPIEFSSAYIITMNLDSFVTLLKMSYSTFNLLHQTQEQ